jgi:hypothetical protein
LANFVSASCATGRIWSRSAGEQVDWISTPDWKDPIAIPRDSACDCVAAFKELLSWARLYGVVPSQPAQGAGLQRRLMPLRRHLSIRADLIDATRKTSRT